MSEHEAKPYKAEVRVEDVLDEAWMFVRYGEDLSVNAKRQVAAFFVHIVDELAARIQHIEDRTGSDPILRTRLDQLCEQYARTEIDGAA